MAWHLCLDIASFFCSDYSMLDMRAFVFFYFYFFLVFGLGVSRAKLVYLFKTYTLCDPIMTHFAPDAGSWL